MQIPVRHAHPFRKDQGHFFSASNIEHFGDLRQHHDGQPLQMWWKDMERTSWQLDFLVQCALPQGPPVMLVACNLSHYRYMMIYIYIYSKIYKYLKIYVYLFISTINQRIPTHTSMYILNIFWGSSPCGYSNDKQPQSCYKTCVRSKPPPFFTPNCGCVTVSLRHTMAFFSWYLWILLFPEFGWWEQLQGTFIFDQEMSTCFNGRCSLKLVFTAGCGWRCLQRPSFEK